MAKGKSAADAAASNSTPAANDELAAIEGLMDGGSEIVLRTNFQVPEQDCIALLHAASLLVDADTPEKVNIALGYNLRMWVAIKSVLQGDTNSLAPEVKANLRNLSDHVAAATMEASKGDIELSRLISLSRLNMHIAEGLLRAQQNKLVQDRAYEIWVQEGRPEGRDMDHWLKAEQEINALFQV